ncbi:MAG: NTPase [Candidatus Hadarchaeia archaeon]
MSHNFLITGPPSIGKSTIVNKVVDDLKRRGLEAGGIYCPEIRENGIRKGFKIIDISSERSKTLAHEQFTQGPKISKYKVNVQNIDYMSKEVLSKAIKKSDFIVIDEIAPMEVHSEIFKDQTMKALESEKPLLAVIHQRSHSGFIGKVKRRSDIRIFEVNEKTRNYLPKKIKRMIRESLS